MNRNLYGKLARNNIRKNKNTYFPYIFSSIIIVALFYILSIISGEIGNIGFAGERTMKSILALGVYVAGMFSLIFILYTNSFLLKRREKELGLYSVLGMEKRHINKVILYETFYIGGISIVFGMLFGLLFSKLMFAFLLNILKLDTSIRLYITRKPMIVTGGIFIGIFVLVMFYNMIKIRRTNPIDLVSGGKKGEREPKGNWIVGLIGLLSLGIGYYIALSIKNPINSIPMFFVAIMFVMVGTYFLFSSGSIIILKLLKKNKTFYYNKKNFIYISNMLYRMKQNAVSLANIAILSTAAILIISTTMSLYLGINDVMEHMYPRDVIIDIPMKDSHEIQDIETIEKIISDRKNENNLQVKNPRRYYSLSYISYLDENLLVADNLVKGPSLENTFDVRIFTIKDYNEIHGQDLELNKGEAYYYSDGIDLNFNSVKLLEKEYKLKGELDTWELSRETLFNEINIIVSDLEEIKYLEVAANEEQNQREQGSSYRVYNIYYNYQFDLDGDIEGKINFGTNLRDVLKNSVEGFPGVRDRYTYSETVQSIYGSVYFIGIFLGILFIVTTVLIIYYKQITEGYEDRHRFKTLQEVGMSKGEVKKAIKSQVLLVFSLPLITAIIHVFVANSIVNKILLALSLTNTRLFLTVTKGVILVFSIAYGIVYRWTAKVYYKIVE